MFHVVRNDEDPETLPLLTPSSISQCTLTAVGVVAQSTKGLMLFVTVCVSGLIAVIRGPRPPAGLTISDVCVSERVLPPSFQLRANVARRKSSPLASLPAALALQALAGAVAP